MKRKDVVFLLIAVYAAAWFASMRLYWDIYAGPIRGTDFSSYYTAGILVREGRAADLYAVAEGDSILGDATAGPWKEIGAGAGVARQHYYIYPPLFAVAFAPLSLLPFGTALDLWLALDLALLGVFIAVYARARDHAMTAPEWAFIGVTCLFEFLPLIWPMAIGQTSLIVLVLLAGVLLAWKRGSDGLAGLLLGVAISIKLTPLLLSLFFWWRGRPRIAMISVAVFVGLQAASIAALGWEPHRIFYLEVVPEMSGGTCYFLNQSLGAFFNRLLTGGDVRQVALVDAPLARALAIGASLLLLGLLAPRLRRERPDVPFADEIQYGAVLLLTLVISPISWTHHYLVALLPIYALAANLGRRAGPPIGPAILLGLAWLLIARKPHAELFLAGPARIFNSAALAGALLLLALSWHALAPPVERRS